MALKYVNALTHVTSIAKLLNILNPYELSPFIDKSVIKYTINKMINKRLALLCQ